MMYLSASRAWARGRCTRRMLKYALGCLTAIAAWPAEAALASNSGWHRSSQTLYVATTGTDSGACGTLTSACATIGYALSQASARDRVLVEPGTYQESDNPNGGLNLIGPQLKGLTLAADRANGATAANTVIDATGESQGIVIQADKATVDGFTVENAQETPRAGARREAA